MPLLTFHVDIRGMRRKFSALVSASTPDAIAEPLLRTGGFVRARIKRDVFDTEGAGAWPALDPETIKRKLTSFEVDILKVDRHKGSGVRQIAAAANRADKARLREKIIARKIAARRRRGQSVVGLEKSHALAQQKQQGPGQMFHDWRARAMEAGFANTGSLVAYARHEIERQKRGVASLRAYKALVKEGHTFTDAERRAMLRKGARRYKASEESTRVLGGLRNTLALHLAPYRIEIFSKAFIGAIHNFGGTAGHGAKIPQRKFMELSEEDIQFLIRILREKMIAAWLDAPAATDNEAVA